MCKLSTFSENYKLFTNFYNIFCIKEAKTYFQRNQNHAALFFMWFFNVHTKMILEILRSVFIVIIQNNKTAKNASKRPNAQCKKSNLILCLFNFQLRDKAMHFLWNFSNTKFRHLIKCVILIC